MSSRIRLLDHEVYTRRKGTAKSLNPALKQLREVENEETRNHIRGVISRHRDKEVSIRDLNRIRAQAGGRDLRIAAEMILGERGIFPEPKTGLTYKDLITAHNLNAIESSAEAYFVVGHINGWKETACNIIQAMEQFASIVSAEPADAANALSLFVDRYGASIYAARKIAYIASVNGEGSELQPSLSKIAEISEQSKSAAPYFMSLELLDCDFPYFSGVSTRVQIYNKYIQNDYRNIFALNELAPTPIYPQDIGGFLRRSYSNSIVDEIQSILVIIQLESNWPEIAKIFKDNLDPEIYRNILSFMNIRFNAAKLFQTINPLTADFVFYRRALAFIEFEECAKYRFKVDRTIVPRLIPSVPKVRKPEFFGNATSAKDLTKSIFGFRKANDYERTQNCGTFLRTVQFLAFLECKSYPTINHQFIRSIFDRTVSLDVLLDENELNQLYEQCDDLSRPLISVLALALHKAKRHDDDVDFTFRYSLAEVVSAEYSGSIESFVEWLLPNTPQIAHYLVSILDRSTLQKLYWLIKTSDQADLVRQNLLRIVGKQRNEIRYYVEADAIEAGRQVAKLKRYFDDSRIYVDGIAFKAWLTANPNSYSQQYVKIIERNYDVLTARTIQVENGNLKISDAFDISTLASYDYVLTEAARVAFQQFCTNRNFGIESYLGRRIRHNTLSGMLRSGVENLIEGGEYIPLRVDKAFIVANREWINQYRLLVEELRKDILQFYTEQRPRGIFKSTLADDENTRNNIGNLRNMVAKMRTPELFNELLIKFCWQEIDPQLRMITRAISGEFLKKANEIVEASIGNFDGDAHRQYRSAVRDAIHERFTRLASWFRQPEDGFVPATTKQLSELIIMEAQQHHNIRSDHFSFSGSGLESMLDGLSVHRIYDCLFVLITNALKYGSDEGPITIDVHHDSSITETFSVMTVKVSSYLINDHRRAAHIQRLKDSFSSVDIGTAMVVEGYSGLKKMRYIIQHSEGIDTVRYGIENDICSVQFTLTVEIAKTAQVGAENARSPD